MTVSPESISSMADRVRRGAAGGITLSYGFIAEVKEAWRDDRFRDDAETIMKHFPGDFPLFGVRQAE